MNQFTNIPIFRGIPRWILLFMFLWTVIALLDPVLAGEGCILPYHFSSINPSESLLPPFSKGTKGMHILGTDKLGRDVAAAMIHGAKVSFVVAFGTIVLSLLFGSILGLLSGYFGNNRVKKNILQQTIILLAICIIGYYMYLFVTFGFNSADFAVFIGWILTFLFVEKYSQNLPLKKRGLPIDFFVQRMFELRETIPSIFIVLAAISIIKSPSYITMIFVISILIWLTFASHFRAQALVLREQKFVSVAKASGMSHARILGFHIFPNAFMPIIVIVIFATSNVILLESTLSFLGLGLPLEEMSWGKLLAASRKSQSAWWLAVFPGLAIFIVLITLNRLGDHLSLRYQDADKN